MCSCGGVWGVGVVIVEGLSPYSALLLPNAVVRNFYTQHHANSLRENNCTSDLRKISDLFAVEW